LAPPHPKGFSTPPGYGPKHGGPGDTAQLLGAFTFHFKLPPAKSGTVTFNYPNLWPITADFDLSGVDFASLASGTLTVSASTITGNSVGDVGSNHGGGIYNAGIATVTYQRSPPGAGTWTTVAAAWNTSAAPDGLYDLRVRVTDNAGNVATSAPVTNRRVDNSAPTLSSPPASPSSRVSIPNRRCWRRATTSSAPSSSR